MRYQLFIFSLLYSIFSFGQSIEARYSHKFNDNLHNLDIKKDSIITIESKPIKYNYSYSKNKSIYKLYEPEISKKDSIKNEYGYYDVTKSDNASRNEIFKDLAKKEFLMEYTIYDTNFSIKDNLQNFEWIFLDEEATIGGYKCKKAISNKGKFTIITWYCEDIPINDGPDRFYGLPGFILKVELGEYSIIEIDQLKIFDKNINIEKPINKNKYLTSEKFNIEERLLFEKKANEN